MPQDQLPTDTDFEWLDHVRPVGLVFARGLLKSLGLSPERQTRADDEAVAALIDAAPDQPALKDPWGFFYHILGWQPANVAGAPDGPPLPADLTVSLPDYDTALSPTWAVRGVKGEAPWQLLVRCEVAGIDPDKRGALSGWEATPHQRFERLLQETEVHAGVLVTDTELRLVYKPKGESSGWLAFPLKALGTVAGRPMLGGLKLALGAFRLLNDGPERRLPALLKASRETQAQVSTDLSHQVLGALHDLLRGLQAADPKLIAGLATGRPQHLYEGLLTVLMRLVFILYAEDRDLIPSMTDARARALYTQGYSVRGLYAKLTEDEARYPDTMDERVGAWGWLLALFRLVHRGHPSGWIKGRGGKLFDPDAFPFLEGRGATADPPRVLPVSDGTILRILRGLMVVDGERISYRTLDVNEIGSVYETVMGFTVETAAGRALAIRAGKNNRTPVFVDLDALAAARAKDRVKYLKEEASRGQLSANVAKAVEAAKSADDLAAALDPILDERGSPRRRAVPAGTPILQPTDERRRTGSHYTPRSLTEPIVRHALEPAFERLGPDATPEQVLFLKVCDPAMGSGAFLVEACRALAARLVQAWERHKDKKPAIPPDEDEDLHARRLVAQRCLYGVDKNPLATDLARLSLWLATLARDHEFTFLDHALKSGDSLVGLSPSQIEAANWDTSKPPLPLLHGLIVERVNDVVAGRTQIQQAPDDVTRAIQEARHRTVEQRIEQPRTYADAIVAAFFSSDKRSAREQQRQVVESLLSGGSRPEHFDQLRKIAMTPRQGDHPIRPFHWHLEFPEVFARENGGFDAIVGNPPFAGKNTITAERPGYLDWLKALHEGAHGNADLVAHFFRRTFNLLRTGGAFGLIATNTIRQGDTRATGLAAILGAGGSISRAIRRMSWPGGDAAVVVSVVHIVKGQARLPVIDERQVSRISAFLVEGGMDGSPARLEANERKAFQGSILLGMGFTFDDVAAARGEAESLDAMHALIAKNPHNAERILPYIGGEEINNSPTFLHRRYAIDFADFPLRREPSFKSWFDWSDERKLRGLREGIVPTDYPNPVAEDWPDLLDVVRRLVKPARDKEARKARRERWWRFGDRQPGLYKAIAPLERVFALSRVSPQFGIAVLASGMVYAESTVVFTFSSLAPFSTLQSRIHELWARFFSSSMKDDLRYAPSDCFETFPFPPGFETDPRLEAAGQAYHDHRPQLMVARNEGMTKTYNRFHDPGETAVDIARLRELHAAMDRAVLEAYGWGDLAERAEPIFLDESNEDDHTYQGRLFWPSSFRDALLSRLLALNASRHAEEVRLGIAPGMKGKAAEDDEEDA